MNDNRNVYRELRERTETDSKRSLKQEELAEEFKKQGTPLTQGTISKLENSTKQPPTTSYNVIEAYCKYFNTTSDYLLGFSDEPSRDMNKINAGNVTGLNGAAIETLSKIRAGNDTDAFFETLNYLIGKDFTLFTQLIDAIRLYFDESYNTPMLVTKEQFEPINNIDNAICDIGNSINIGKYDKKLCNNTGGYRVIGLPVSLVRESYSMYTVQHILEELKNKKESDT